MNATSSLTGKYLTFKLQTESYGIEVLKVREIIHQTTITSLPQMAAHFRGVINLRGKIVPIMDLRKRFGLAVADDEGDPCVIVVQTKLTDHQTVQVGLVVDAVEEVIHLSGDDIEPTPHFGGRMSTGCIVGIAKVKGAAKTLLDIDGLVGTGATH